jgi:glycosyltransferase involved in cell wall biosynthesis
MSQRRTLSFDAVIGAATGIARRVWPHSGQLLLVVDKAGWVVDEFGHSLLSGLPVHLRARVVGGDWLSARKCTIHFINRSWAWTDGILDRVHPSNRIIGLWQHGRLDAPEQKLQVALDRLRQLHHKFERIQVLCSSARETLLALGVPASKVILLPQGVDLMRFRPVAGEVERTLARRMLGVSDHTVVIGSFQKDGDGWGDGYQPKLIKGPDVLADAVKRLRAHCPVHVLLPGPARGYLTRRLQDAGVPFTAPGFVSSAEIPRLYHALDIYVSPSRDEGGPQGVLEAMASGVPVVSTRTGMAADLIESGVNGVLVPIDDAGALADAVLDLAGKPPLGASMAKRAQGTIAAYDWSLLAQDYAKELYAP